MRKRSIIIGLITVKLLLDIVILIIILILIFYAITAVANLAIFEDKKYISLINKIERVMDNCIRRGQCEEDYWIENFNYDPTRFSIYFNYSEGRIYLIKCNEPEGDMYFDIKQSTFLSRNFNQNCEIIKRTKQILTPDTRIIIESLNDDILIYILGISIDEVPYLNVEACIIKIFSVDKRFEINISSPINDLGSFLFGAKSEISVNREIKIMDLYTCTKLPYVINSKKDLAERKLLTSPPMHVFINPLQREIRFIIPKQ